MNTAGYSFGPRVTADGVEFRVWAPAGTLASIEVSSVGSFPLVDQGDGWYGAQVPCGAGARYLYKLRDGRMVPDPASRWQPEGTGGPSVVTESAFPWQRADWRGRPWHSSVIYELHVGLCGGYKGVRERLAELAAIGFTAIELMPIAQFSGQRNWGYDGVLPFAPAAAYGTPAELKALVDHAHSLGLMVYLDVVYNHFGPDGNWLREYAPQFFREDVTTPWGAAIDFRRDAVSTYFLENARYWLHEYRFDGLRFDAVHSIAEQDWLHTLSASIRDNLPADREVHLILENEANRSDLLEAGFDAQWNDDFHNAIHVLLTDETHSYYADFAAEPEFKLARALSEGFVYQGEASPRKRHPRGQKSGHLPPTAFVSFLQNHDQIGNRAFGDRLTKLIEPAHLRAAIALLLLSPQIPMIFMGEETGATEPFLFFTDFHGDLGRAVREGRRREFAGGAGFGAHDAEPIPDPNALETFEVSRLDRTASGDQSWRELYRNLLALRREWLAAPQKARSLGAAVIGRKAVRAEWQLDQDNKLVLIANLGDAAVATDLPSGQPIWGTASDNIVPPGETLVWAGRHV